MAMAQSAHVAELLTARTGCQVELVGLSTTGDVSRAELTQIGGTGVFVSTLRERLLERRDRLRRALAEGPPDLDRERAGARGRAAAGMTRGTRWRRATAPSWLICRQPRSIGTGSPRRAAQLLMIRPDLRPVPIRGNAGTRLAGSTSGEVDAVVLAYAGLARIGRLDVVSQVFEPEEMMPAPGQGALAVECLASRTDLAELLGQIDDWASRAATDAERSLLAALQAGCTAPVGAYAAGTDALRLDAIVAAADGGEALRASAAGPAGEAGRIGRQVAAELLRRGAGRYTDVSAGHLTNGDDA